MIHLFQVNLNVGDRIKDTFAYNTQENSLGQLIGNVVSLIIIFAFLLFLFYLIVSGVNWITAEGKPDKLEKARNQLVQAIVGLAITMGAWAIWVLMQHFFGINLSS